MQLKDLPGARVMAATANIDVLTQILQTVFGAGTEITYSVEITGEKQTTMMLCCFPYLDGKPLVEGLNPWFMANHLRDLSRSAIYDPPKKPGKKGWLIKRASIDGRPIVIVSTCWTSQ